MLRCLWSTKNYYLCFFHAIQLGKRREAKRFCWILRAVTRKPIAGRDLAVGLGNLEGLFQRGCFCGAWLRGDHFQSHTSSLVIAVPIPSPTPPWKQGLNALSPLLSHDTLPCNSPSTSTLICHFSSLLFPFFSGPDDKFQKAGKAASVCKTPPASTA